jgi:hypothetical protein
VEVVRHTDAGRVTGQASPDAPLQPGDEVTVLERHF